MAASDTTMVKALPTQARSHNKAVVLRLLYPDRRMTRADLARATGLTRVIISDIVAELIDEGFVVEGPLSDAKGPGKRGRLVRIDERSRAVIAIDLSQPYVLGGAVMDLAGHILRRSEVAVPDCREVPLDLVGRLCDDLTAVADSPLLGVGVSSPGIVSSDGMVMRATNIGWRHVQLHDFLTQRSGAPVFVDNDANIEAVAELRFGERDQDMMLIQMSRGIGIGLILSGGLVRGSNMAAGEIGHVVVEPEGKLCRCGKRGCLETVVSMPDLLARIEREPGERSNILRQAGAYLGDALSVALGLVDLPKIMVLGDSRVVNGTFLEAVEKQVNKDLAMEFRRNIVVHRSALGGDANLMGACAAVLDGCLMNF